MRDPNDWSGENREREQKERAVKALEDQKNDPPSWILNASSVGAGIILALFCLLITLALVLGIVEIVNAIFS